MTLNNLKKIFLSQLTPIFLSQEINSFFYLLLERYTSMTRVDLALDPNKKISSEIQEKFNSALVRLKKEEPIQYIIGETEFYGLTFKLNNTVLIPRPETEELLDWVINEIETNDLNNVNLKILDIGTGSGCIAISLAKNLPKTKVWALDVSKRALMIAKTNAIMNNVKINFKQIDILKTYNIGSKYDIIISNPPYIREFEKKQMRNNVLKHEPSGALFVNDNEPLLFYDKISELALKSLNPQGNLYVEINQALGKEIINLLKEKGFINIELKNDIFGANRMVKAQFH